jgi:hypothetical protein
MVSVPMRPGRASHGFHGWIEVLSSLALCLLIWSVQRARVLSLRLLVAVPAAALGMLAALLLFRLLLPLLLQIIPRKDPQRHERATL